MSEEPEKFTDRPTSQDYSSTPATDRSWTDDGIKGTRQNRTREVYKGRENEAALFYWHGFESKRGVQIFGRAPNFYFCQSQPRIFFCSRELCATRFHACVILNSSISNYVEKIHHCLDSEKQMHPELLQSNTNCPAKVQFSMYGAVCFPEIERNQSFCDKEQRFLTKCMPVYDDEGDYENPQPTKWPHFDEGGWLKNLYSHHTWEADDKEFIEHVNKRECGDYDHSLMLPDRMYLEWCQTPDTNNSIKGSFYPCITEKAFEEKHPNYASEILRDMVYLGLPFIAFILTSSTTLVLVKFFRRSKRILVYINMFLSMSLFSLCYVVNIWIYRQYAKMRLENSEKIINVLGTYINSLMEGKHPGHNGTEELFLMQHDLFLEPKHCNTSHEEQHYTQMNCSTLDYLEDKAEKAGCGREEFRDDKSSLATYCIIFGLLESYFWMTKFTWFILQAVYLVMLNLCTYNSLSIFQSNMFIWIGWLAPLPFLAGFASNFFFSKDQQYDYSNDNLFCGTKADSSDYHSIYVFTGICLAINSIFFIIVVYQVYRIHSNTRAGIWRVTRAVYYLIPLFNILHILEITDTNFFRVVYTPYGTPFFSLVITAVVEFVYPLIICVLFVFMSREFKSKLKRFKKNLANQTPLLYGLATQEIKMRNSDSKPDRRCSNVTTETLQAETQDSSSSNSNKKEVLYSRPNLSSSSSKE